MHNKPFLITLSLLIVVIVAVGVLGYFHLQNDKVKTTNIQQYLNMATDLENKANATDQEALSMLDNVSKLPLAPDIKVNYADIYLKAKNLANDYRQQALQYRKLAQGG
jgi:hypothetical protein